MPVLAAPDRDVFCDDQDEATLDISAEELSARPVSHDLDLQKNHEETETVSADKLLKPRFDATVRKVFAEDEDELQETEAEAEEPAARRVRVPGVSDEDLVRIKRQMYRRDI